MKMLGSGDAVGARLGRWTKAKHRYHGAGLVRFRFRFGFLWAYALSACLFLLSLFHERLIVQKLVHVQAIECAPQEGMTFWDFSGWRDFKVTTIVQMPSSTNTSAALITKAWPGSGYASWDYVCCSDWRWAKVLKLNNNKLVYGIRHVGIITSTWDINDGNVHTVGIQCCATNSSKGNFQLLIDGSVWEHTGALGKHWDNQDTRVTAGASTGTSGDTDLHGWAFAGTGDGERRDDPIFDYTDGGMA